MTTRLRNIGIIAHVDAGKTTTSERILYFTGRIHGIGDVDRGNTTLDFDPEEIQRGITINSAVTTVRWRDARINLIDTPGHVDFNIEVNRALRVLDGAVVVLDAVAGVEPQTEANWRLADAYGVPRLCFVNKLDRTGSDFGRAVAGLRERLSARPLVLQLPVGAEADFRGVVDLVAMRALSWPAGDGSPAVEAAIPPALLAPAQAARAQLVEAVVEQDEAAIEQWLHSGSLDEATLRACIRKACIAGAGVPVLAGSAWRNRGIEPLLDAVVDYLPEPHEVNGADATGAALPRTADGPFAALAFKLVEDSHGSMVLLRVYRGRARKGTVVLNPATGERHRIARVCELHADQVIERDALCAGDILGVIGLKGTLTGHTLCDPGSPLVLEELQVPAPVIEVAVEPRTRAESQVLGRALQWLAREDPSLRVRQDAESGQTLLAAMGELQIEVSLRKLQARFGVALKTGRPQVAYRETITKSREVRHVLKKQNGGHGMHAEVVLRLAPRSRGAGIRFAEEVKGGAVPREFIPAVEAGIRRAAAAGVLAGFPCVDFEAVLLDGGFHERDSSPLAFELAAAAAFREAFATAGPVLLEPLMRVEVVAPGECLGACIGDLGRRRGVVRGSGTRGAAATVEACVPLREMFGYIGDLRSLTSGRGMYSMRLEGYAAAPAEVTEQVAA